MSTAELTDESISDAHSLGDAELLERFVVAREEGAFSELVRRHGPVVLGVCRRILRDSHDVDDVFQATFLVLFRDAPRVRERKSVAGWLYGVAHRLSLHVCRQRQRRRETVLADDISIGEDLLRAVIVRHNQQQLDLELDRLPERYRQPLVLRFLAGKSSSEVATELGMTVGTVEGLVKRGKAVLRTRLMRQGITLSAAGLALQAFQLTARAATPETLIERTIESAATGAEISGLSAEVVSGLALDLLGKELVVMTTATKTALALGITVGGLVVGIGGFNLLTTHQGAHAQAAGPMANLSLSNAVHDDLEIAMTTADPVAKAVAPDLTGTIVTSETSGSISASKEAGNTSQGLASRWDFKARSKKIAMIEEQLQKSTEVNFTDVSLKDSLDYLTEFHKIDIWIDLKSLSEEGISPDTTVTLLASGQSLKSTFRLLLDPLALDYLVHNDVLEITTREKARLTFETRVYNLGRLHGLKPKELEEIIATTIEPQSWRWLPEGRGAVSLGSTVIGNSVGGSPSSQGIVPGAADAGTGGGAVTAAADDLGSIRATEKSLVIRQTQRVHELIVDLLDQLKNEQ